VGRTNDDDLGPEGLEVAADLEAVCADCPEEGELERMFDAPGPEVLEEEYPDFDNTNTRIISGPIGGAKFPGYRSPTWRAAKAHAAEVGDVVKFWTVPGRWFARIRRTSGTTAA
jgi:hypothetical protein